MPIELISFEASVNGQAVDIYWTTATEINNDFFTIERSTNGKQFEELIFADGAGNSTSELDYMEKDYDPHGGISYYRLKQTDFDGTYSYSQIVAVKRMENNTKQMLIYPNPAFSNGDFKMTLSGFENEEV